ncbi:hypothetical protein [Streptomyces sp. NPDC088847]|uniref:hypothetical protein n=1 Tax=Streptomyces sp. NPDC088847 TaxID=3365909 RepID=UPI00380E199E
MRTTTATALGLLLLTAGLTACSGGSSSTPSHTDAEVMCEKFVKNRLKSPGSARFPGVTDSDYAKTKVLSNAKPWKFTVTGVVDSQNGFGALVRSNYVCTVSTKNRTSWHLDDMDMHQR